MLAYILDNREWIFSGWGIAFFSAFIALVQFTARQIIKHCSKAPPPNIDPTTNMSGHFRSNSPTKKPEQKVPARCIVKSHHIALKKVTAALDEGKSVVWLDVDRFTQINKIFGEKCGDRIIETILEIIFSKINELAIQVDVFHAEHRDEFFLVGPCKQLETANIGSIIRAIQQYDWSDIAPQLFVTCSAGIAQYQGDPVHALKRARVSLNHIKSKGGNGVGAELMSLNPFEDVGLFES